VEDFGIRLSRYQLQDTDGHQRAVSSRKAHANEANASRSYCPDEGFGIEVCLGDEAVDGDL